MLVMTVYVERIHMDVLFDLAEGLVWVKKERHCVRSELKRNFEPSIFLGLELVAVTLVLKQCSPSS